TLKGRICVSTVSIVGGCDAALPKGARADQIGRVLPSQKPPADRGRGCTDPGPIVTTVLTVKAGICVSTVSIVSACGTGRPHRVPADRARVVVANVTGQSRCRLVADAADGTDGIFLSCSYPNDPASGPAFPTVDAQCPQERLRATQAASELKRSWLLRWAPASQSCPSMSCARP